MENLGEIMKSCLNCNDLTRHNDDCLGCVNEGIHINWKPVVGFQPLPMEETKVEDYEVTTQADGLVHLMTKVDEVISKDNAPVRFDGIAGTVFDNETQQIPEPIKEQTLANNNLKIFKQIQNKSHLCHYTKFQLDFDINTSIRFIHAFDDRPELVGKFIYKHHEEKLFSVIEPQLAEHFIKTQCSNEAEEFINRYVGQGKKRQYRRIKVTENSLTKYFES